MAEHLYTSVPEVADRLRSAMDVEGKIPRALEALGPVAGRDVALVDGPGVPSLHRLQAAGAAPIVVPSTAPLRVPVPDGSLDAVVSLWAGFRGVARPDLDEADRALRPGGRLLVVHDYGRDEVSSLRDADAPEYVSWSRREGPFLRGGGFRIRVLHCFWTFGSLEEAQEVLGQGFGARGEALGRALRRPRLTWNVAVYHRWRSGIDPEA